ncbi:hypothetical protein E2542_SST15249 [Spatholobus suberectus]|nr:hypothetical protein E2542_SST15249 [Spatholobus suberectus]
MGNHIRKACSVPLAPETPPAGTATTTPTHSETHYATFDHQTFSSTTANSNIVGVDPLREAATPCGGAPSKSGFASGSLLLGGGLRNAKGLRKAVEKHEPALASSRAFVATRKDVGSLSEPQIVFIVDVKDLRDLILTVLSSALLWLSLIVLPGRWRGFTPLRLLLSASGFGPLASSVFCLFFQT